MIKSGGKMLRKRAQKVTTLKKKKVIIKLRNWNE